MEQLYTIHFIIDYRGLGIDYEKVSPNWAETLEEEGTMDNRFEVKLKHPETGYKVYWGCEFPNYTLDKEWLFDTKEAAIQHMHKIYSQINDRLPFVVTGHNSAYKEQGHYPEVSEEIKNMPTVELPYEVITYSDNYYYMVMIDTEDIVYVLPLECG